MIYAWDISQSEWGSISNEWYFSLVYATFFFKARFESVDLIWEISSLGLLDIILSKKIDFLEKLH